MKKKLVAMLFVLWSYNNQSVHSTDTATGREPLTIETIIVRQLEQLKNEFDVDTYSQTIISEFTLKGDFTLEVRREIRAMCKELQIKEEWLYKLFDIESNGNPAAINKLSGASGLIQFMPSTAKNLGTTTEEIQRMSISEQLPFVKKYISKIKKDRQFNEFLDLYLAVFYPHAIDKPLDFVLGSEVSTNRALLVGKQNKGIDKRGDQDGTLTKEEIYNWVS